MTLVIQLVLLYYTTAIDSNEQEHFILVESISPSHESNWASTRTVLEL